MSCPVPLPASFQRHGFTYVQLERSGAIALFAIRTPSGGCVGWEVVRIRVAKQARVPGGKIIPEREVYPSDEDFGTHGWCYAYERKSHALAHFQTLSRSS